MNVIIGCRLCSFSSSTLFLFGRRWGVHPGLRRFSPLEYAATDFRPRREGENTGQPVPTRRTEYGTREGDAICKSKCPKSEHRILLLKMCKLPQDL
ncbi:unnamed protein product [Cuscuta campestris]|uniref:Uncharacterized protein n=1 Tax=Cuscuta campestris TaxID=132261 RepID=A0A484NBK9_9ASTE|nr:unnamed protein product [Cuscuta campestris]